MCLKDRIKIKKKFTTFDIVGRMEWNTVKQITKNFARSINFISLGI